MTDPRDLREALLEIEANRLARAVRKKQIEARLSELKALKPEARTETWYSDPVGDSFLERNGFFPNDDQRKAERERLEASDIDCAATANAYTTISPEQIEIMELEKELEALDMESKIDSQMKAIGAVPETASPPIMADANRDSDAATTEPTVWKRSLRDFVDWIVGAREKGQIHADSDRQAVISAARQFVTINPKTGQKEPIDGKSAWQSWKNKKDEGK